MKIFICCFLLVFCGLPAFAGNYKAIPSLESKEVPQISPQERERLSREAKQLAEEFKDLFKDLSATGQTFALAFVDYIAVWIKDNYARISEEQRRKLKQLFSETKKQLDQFGEMSTEALLALFEDIVELLKELEEGLSDPDGQQKDSEVIVI